MAKQTISNADQLYYGHIRANDSLYGINGRNGLPITPVVQVSLGTPIIGDADGVTESQNLTAAGVWSVDVTTVAAMAAALASTGTGPTNDVPRALVAAWTGTAVMTITGTDMYGNVMSEASASGTSFTGKKAFKTITAISVSADVTGLTVGTGDVLGLPYNLQKASDVLNIYFDNAADAATVVVADWTTPATTTTGDVRGTMNFAGTLNGTKECVVWFKPRGAASKEEMIGYNQA